MEQGIILNSMEPLQLQEIVENSIRKVFIEFSIQNKTGDDYSSDLFSISDAAKYINLAIPTIYGLVATLTIPHMKKGKRLYFSRLELENWVKSGRRKTISEKDKELIEETLKMKAVRKK